MNFGEDVLISAFTFTASAVGIGIVFASSGMPPHDFVICLQCNAYAVSVAFLSRQLVC